VEETETTLEGLGTEDCDPELGVTADGTCHTTETAFMETFNSIMLIANGALLAYSFIVECVLVAVQKRLANVSCCNSYLILQLIAGVTSRAVVLLSAQLVAAFIIRVDALSYTMGMVLGIALILSQARAIQMFLAAFKRDLNSLLPTLERNYEMALSTNYLAYAALYKKLSVEPTRQSRQTYKDMIAQIELQQSHWTR
jgi:hypothetical protein